MNLSSRRLAIALVAMVVVTGAAIMAWDFLQLGRKVPELVAAESRADLIKVDKSKRTLTLLRGTDIIRTYRVSLGSAPDGHKSREGDRRTPEGRYSIDSRNPRSRFHLALRISYPNAGPFERAAA